MEGVKAVATTDTHIKVTLESGVEIMILPHQNGLRINVIGFGHNLAIEPIQANSILVVPVKGGLRSFDVQ